VYGPVRTVVWQGSAGDCRPYADLVGYSEVTAMESSQKQLRILRCALNDSAVGGVMSAGLGITPGLHTIVASVLPKHLCIYHCCLDLQRAAEQHEPEKYR
jgi:hypothetical protein